MVNAKEAEQFKDAGNKALQSGDATAAIENYTKAINADGTNHVYYSNRSAAYLKNGDGNNALEDAISTISINPEFSKGYSRKGGELFRSFSCRHLWPSSAATAYVGVS
jgi:tetratricopeptide (TPR) repeat protein